MLSQKWNNERRFLFVKVGNKFEKEKMLWKVEAEITLFSADNFGSEDFCKKTRSRKEEKKLKHKVVSD